MLAFVVLKPLIHVGGNILVLTLVLQVPSGVDLVDR